MGALTTEGVRQLESEVDHSSPSGAKIKNAWSYKINSPLHPQGVVLN